MEPTAWSDYEILKNLHTEIDQLREENARLREELAAAQAVIEQMREALDWTMGFADSAISDGFRELGGESISDETHKEAKRYWERETKTFDGYKHLLAAPTNLDALHEDRARECERMADMLGIPASAETLLREQAAAHRARKEGK